MKTVIHIHDNQGLSLIELLIAMTLGLLLISGAVGLFVTNKRVYTEQNEMGVLQDNARFAMGLLAHDIRMIGYVGCHDNPSNIINNLNGVSNATNILNFTHPIEGTEGSKNWQPSNSNNEISKKLADTDGITVRYFQPFGVNTIEAMTTTTADVIIADNNKDTINSNDILAISDCVSADIFQNTSTGNTGSSSGSSGTTTTGKHAIKHAKTTGGSLGNKNNALSKNYPSGSALNRIIARRYFIRNDTSKNPGLWWQQGQNAEKLLDGVESMRILYGEDTGNDGVADSYNTADNVTNWNAVVSIQIALLMRTVEEYGTIKDTQTYQLLDKTIDPTDDRRRRRVFTTTIQIRNRTST